MIGLIEKAEPALGAETAQAQADELVKGRFPLEDWLELLKQIKKMGSTSQIMGMLPGQFGQAARVADPRELENALRYLRPLCTR